MNLQSITKLKCPQCAAPVSANAKKCQYCGTEFIIETGNKSFKLFSKPLNTKDFGRKTLLINIIGIIVLHIIAWLLTGENYWDDTPFYMWFGILPLWVTIMTTFWLKKHFASAIGILFSIIVFAANLIFIYIKENGRFNDDFLIVAGFISLAFFTSWIIGRIFHSIIRFYINNTESLNKKFKE